MAQGSSTQAQADCGLMVRVLKGRIEVRTRRGWLRLVLWADAGDALVV